MDCDAFIIRKVATAGHEILAPDGNAVAWAATEAWALAIAALLSRVESEGLESLSGSKSDVLAPKNFDVAAR